MIMADLEQMQVRTLVDETDMGEIRDGMRASVQVEAYPDLSFIGEVEKIEPQAVVQQNVTMFPVIVRLDNSSSLLRPGMNAEVVVEIAESPAVLLIPNAAVVTPQEAVAAAMVLGLPEDAVDMRSMFAGMGGGRGGGPGSGRQRAGGPGAGREDAGQRGGRPGAGSGGGDRAASGGGQGRPGAGQARPGEARRASIRSAPAWPAAKSPRTRPARSSSSGERLQARAGSVVEPVKVHLPDGHPVGRARLGLDRHGSRGVRSCSWPGRTGRSSHAP